MENPRPDRVRKIGVALFCLALLATLFGAFHLIENWRGQKKWEIYKRQLIARGARLDLAAFVPPSIPTEQNFAATPFFAELFPGPKPTNWNRRWPDNFSKMQVQTVMRKGKGRQINDLVACQRTLRSQAGGDTNAISGDRAKAAEEVLAALKVYEPALQELRAASTRPLSRYDIRYDLENPWGILLPHLAVMKELMQLLGLKACAELAAGNNERALEDVRLMVRVVDSMQNEVFLINYLVRVACFQIALQPVWEGLALDRWADPQLEELQRMMLRLNFVDDLRTPFQAEQAAGILTADLVLKQRYKWDFLNALMGSEEGNICPPEAHPAGNIVIRLIPRGWYRMEQYEYAHLFQQFVLPGSDLTNRTVSPAVIERNQAQLKGMFPGGWRTVLKHRFLATLMLPAVSKTHAKAAHAQTAAHQAAIACALERYRRKHGQYPAALTLLAPEFINPVPHDAIGGKPMRYKSTKPIAIYSVGWDETDNGGTPGKLLWDERGDWVWTYPQ
jgi:hypothetical protein